MAEYKLNTPLTDEDMAQLKAGDVVFLTGTIYSARDAAHKKLVELLDAGKELPFELKGAAIYYVGPSPAPPGRPIGAAGPTTSYRMDSYAPRLYSLGLKATIGKGKRNAETRKAMQDYTAVYFGATGGAGALLSNSIVKSEVIAFDELGPEAGPRDDRRGLPAAGHQRRPRRRTVRRAGPRSRRHQVTHNNHKETIMALFTKQEALDYHSMGRKGKVEVVPVKPCKTQKHLSMAYSPGVAEACKAIHADPELVYEYTGRGNLVAVVSNGTAVLGLGNIGPLAGKPVMEGKGVLFKVFGDVDVYDINLDVTDPDKLCEVVKTLEPTFGGINLEDIKAPECFYIEEKLKKEMGIPVFHDDQHGTAIVTAAGMMNAIEISGKNPADMRVVISGAGAAAIACTNLYRNMGVKFENIAMFDSKGHINKSRTDLNEFKQQ